MNMRDLSKDDDFLSHLLVEKLGTGGVPLLVHKMDASRRLPRTDATDLMKIVRRLVVSKGLHPNVVRQAVNELLEYVSLSFFFSSNAVSVSIVVSCHTSPCLGTACLAYLRTYHSTTTL
jgi:histone-lysine N-methyltransferase SUV420H